MNSCRTQQETIRIAVRGMKIGLPHHDFQNESVALRFILSDTHGSAASMHGGLFVNNEAYSESVLQWPRERRLCALIESPINSCFRDTAELERRFPLILTHRQELLRKGPPYRQLFFGTSWIGLSTTGDVERIRTEHPTKSKSVSFIGNIQHARQGAYQFRQNVAEAMLKRADVDCFGKGIREVPKKREALEPYCFSIAMENASEDLYFSEKLIDCMLLETVPIYYGCQGISQLFNAAGLLQFQSLDELEQIMSMLSESLWLERRTAVLENKRRILENGWYSHRSLLDRIAVEFLDTAPQHVLSTPGQVEGKFSRWTSEFSNRVQSLLRWK